MQSTKRILYKESKKVSKPDQSAKVSVTSRFLNDGEYRKILTSELDTSPLNYRKLFPQKELNELAADIVQHGIISNLVVRLAKAGRFEVVTGERRFRAAKIAGLLELPVHIVSLSDQEVIEIQLSENLQRSDTHPMEEAIAIENLQNVYQNIEDVAYRMGKSKAFVYRRLKLICLIDGFRELFLADKCTVQQAYDIASLSVDSQTDFYNESCSDWQTENFEMSDTAYVLDRFRHDLTEAPFDTKDPELNPAMGACNSCPFNSAIANSLFPDMTKESVCSNKVCYNKKCLVNFSWKVNSILVEDKPEALLFQGSPDRFQNLIKLIPGGEAFPKFNFYNIQTLDRPEMPTREDYVDENDDLGDEEGFKEALQEYENELDEYEEQTESGNYRKGLLISERKIAMVLFNSENVNDRQSIQNCSKAADVQSAIKSGTATVELLQGEINRIHAKEERSIELDREKVQIMVQEKFMESLDNSTCKPTSADLVAIRLILFQSLDYSARNTVLQKLFIENEKFEFHDGNQLYRQMENLSEEQFTYLIRLAVASKLDSKNPNSETGYFLYKMAGQAGLNLENIENGQKEKADKRQVNQLGKISTLKKQMEKIKP